MLRSRVVQGLATGGIAVLMAGTFGSAAQADTGDLFLVNGPTSTGTRAGSTQVALQFVHKDSPTGPVVEGQAINFLVSAGPSQGRNGVANSDASGVARFTYGTDHLKPAGGADEVTAWIDTDGNGQPNAGEVQSKTSLVTLPERNSPPVANDVVAETEKGKAVDIRLSGSDPDGGRVGYEVVRQPTHGDVPSYVSSSVITYTPDAGYVGDDSFDYEVTDGNGESARATARIRIADVKGSDGGETPVVPTMCEGKAATVTAQAGIATVFGTAGPDVIAGTSGDEAIYGLGGDDVICAGGGADSVYGGGGSDQIVAAAGSTVSGGDGNDTIVVTGSGVTVYGGTGDDDITANGPGAGVYGSDGNDKASVSTGLASGGAGDDDLTAISPNGTLWGGDGADTMRWPSVTRNH